MLRAKLRVSQPGDPDEAEADRAAEKIVAATHASKIQRKCACSGTGSPCAKCEQEETGTIHRSVASPILRSSQLSLQRAPAGPAPANTPDQAGNPPKPSPTPSHAHPLIVEDDAKSVAPHQMRKSAFIALLRADACATADAVLTSVGRTTKSCPYIEKWLAFYEKQSSDHIERAILKYAPEAATARSAHEAIRLTVMRVQRAATTWAKTGKLTDLPADLAGQIPGQGVLGAVQSFASSGVGGAVLGFLGASKPEKSAADAPADKSPAPSISRKANGVSAGGAPAHDAGAVRSQLGAGHSLDSRVQSQMSTAFGHDFSGVRVHTDSRASAVSSHLSARAFTIGSDVAFASGEYKPGTPIGDALIAHELAHVVQQSAAAPSPPMSKVTDHSAGSTESLASQLENDADLSAVGAVASIWAGAKRGLADLRQNAIPRLRSGLRLQRCSHTPVIPKGVDLDFFWTPEDIVKIFVAGGEQGVIETFTRLGYSIVSFTAAFDTYRFNDGSVHEVPVPGLQGNTSRNEKKIRLFETMSNQQAATALFHEVGHAKSGPPHGLEEEIRVRITTEHYLIKMGWPPYEPSYRKNDGSIDEAAIRADIMGSNHYNPTNRHFVSRRWEGEKEILAARWSLP